MASLVGLNISICETVTSLYWSGDGVSTLGFKSLTSDVYLIRVWVVYSGCMG